MVKALTVKPPAHAGALPAADVGIDLVEYDFVFTHPLTRGSHVIAVTNSGAQPHMLVFKRFPLGYPAGTTAPVVTAWALNPQGKIGPGEGEGGVTEIATGSTVVMRRDFAPGLYLLICFSADDKDGKPHFKHGMQKEIRIE
jgi:hypothetical protein